MLSEETKLALRKEFLFLTSRSGGAGGQHVNKVESKVQIKWDVMASQVFEEEDKDKILKKLAKKITTDGVLMVTAQGSRSQMENKEVALEQLFKWIDSAFKVVKIRRQTKPRKADILKRLDEKKMVGEKKKSRAKVKVQGVI